MQAEPVSIQINQASTFEVHDEAYSKRNFEKPSSEGTKNVAELSSLPWQTDGFVDGSIKTKQTISSSVDLADLGLITGLGARQMMSNLIVIHNDALPPRPAETFSQQFRRKNSRQNKTNAYRPGQASGLNNLSQYSQRWLATRDPNNARCAAQLSSKDTHGCSKTNFPVLSENTNLALLSLKHAKNNLVLPKPTKKIPASPVTTVRNTSGRKFQLPRAQNGSAAKFSTRVPTTGSRWNKKRYSSLPFQTSRQQTLKPKRCVSLPANLNMIPTPSSSTFKKQHSNLPNHSRNPAALRSTTARSKTCMQKPYFQKRAVGSSQYNYLLKNSKLTRKTLLPKSKPNAQIIHARRSMSLPNILQPFCVRPQLLFPGKDNSTGTRMNTFGSSSKPPTGINSRHLKNSPVKRGFHKPKAGKTTPMSKTSTNQSNAFSKDSAASLVSTQLNASKAPGRSRPNQYRYSPSRALKKPAAQPEAQVVSYKKQVPSPGQRVQNVWHVGALCPYVGAGVENQKSRSRSTGSKTPKKRDGKKNARNVKKTALVFQFQTERWRFNSTASNMAVCGLQDSSLEDDQDCFAAWEITEHEVLQSCRSEDLLIMQNALARSSHHTMKALDFKKNGVTAKMREEKDFSESKQQPGSKYMNTTFAASQWSLSSRGSKTHSEYTTTNDVSSPSSRWSPTSSLTSSSSPSRNKWSIPGFHPQPPSVHSENSTQVEHKISQKPTESKKRVKRDPKNKKRESSSREHSNQKSPKGKRKQQVRSGQSQKLRQNRCKNPQQEPFKQKNTKSGLNFNTERDGACPQSQNHQKHGDLLISSRNSTETSDQPGEKRNTFAGSRRNRSLRITCVSKGKGKTPAATAAKKSSGQNALMLCKSKEKQLASGSSPSPNSIQKLLTCSLKQSESESCDAKHRISLQESSRLCFSITRSRIIRTESRKMVSDAKKCDLVVYNGTQKTPLSVWKWRIFVCISVVLLVLCHYMAFLATTAMF